MVDVILYNTWKCESVSFTETDSLLDFKSNDSVCISKIIETELTGTGKVFVFREIIER